MPVRGRPIPRRSRPRGRDNRRRNDERAFGFRLFISKYTRRFTLAWLRFGIPRVQTVASTIVGYQDRNGIVLGLKVACDQMSWKDGHPRRRSNAYEYSKTQLTCGAEDGGDYGGKERGKNYFADVVALGFLSGVIRSYG